MGRVLKFRDVREFTGSIFDKFRHYLPYFDIIVCKNAKYFCKNVFKVVENVREKVYNLGVVVEKRIILHKLGEFKMENTMLTSNEEKVGKFEVNDSGWTVANEDRVSNNEHEIHNIKKREADGGCFENIVYGTQEYIDTNKGYEGAPSACHKGHPTSTHEVSRELKIERRIVDILLNIGITANLHGYIFLKESIKLALETPAFMCSISKTIYPKVSLKFGSSTSQIERSIRRAIEVSYNKDKITHLNDIFDLPAFGKYEQPTTTEFLALIANRLALEFY